MASESSAIASRGRMRLPMFISGHRFLCRHGTVVNRVNDINGRKDRPFHPGAQVTQVLPGQVHAAIRLKEGVVVVLPGRTAPAGRTAQCPRDAVPADSEALAVVLFVVLRVNLAAMLESPPDALFGGHAGHVVGDVTTIRVSAQQYALLLRSEERRVGKE